MDVSVYMDSGENLGHALVVILMLPSQPVYMLMIFWFFFSELGSHSVNSSKVIGNFPEVLNFNRLFLKLNRLICN